MERKFDMRNTPDPTRNEQQCLSPLILANIKKEPADDYVNERIPLQSSCSPYVCNSDIRVKTEDSESRPECEVMSNNGTLQNDCSTAVCNSGFRIKTDDPDSRPRSKPVCQVTPENRPRKRTAEESNPFLCEKLELIRKRPKQEPPESPPPPPVVDDDLKNDRGKADAAPKKVFKLIPLSQIRNMTAKDNIKLVPISEIKNIKSISLREHLLNGSEAKRLRTSPGEVFSDPPNAPAPATPDCKSGEHQLNESEAKWFKTSSEEVFSSKSNASAPATPQSDEPEAETFNTDTVEFFNACSIIDKNDLEQGLEYISTVPLNRNFEMFYKRKKRFGEKQQQKVSEESLTTASQESSYFGFGAPVVNSTVAKPISEGVLEVSPKASSASPRGLQPAVACAAQPDCEAAVSCISMPSVLQSVTKTVSKLTSKVLGTAVVFPSCKSQPSYNSESGLLKPHSSENSAARPAAKFAPQITRIASVVAASNEQQPKTSCPTLNYLANESTPGIPSAQELQDILSLVESPQFCSPAQPQTISSSKGRRLPVVNRFLATRNVDFN